MPISDVARQLLNRRNEPPPEDAHPDPDAPDPGDTGRSDTFSQRAAREDERFRLATDSEYWVCLCFRDPTEPDRFADALGLTVHDGRFVKGPDFTQEATKRRSKPVNRVRQLLAARSTAGEANSAADRLAEARTSDPLRGMTYTGDIQADSYTEFSTLLEALQAPPDPDPVDVHDSPHWLCIYWVSRGAKDATLADTGLEVLGDKYLDGHQAASILHINL